MESAHTSSITTTAVKMLCIFQITAAFWLISQFLHGSSAYELQDTIHSLKEENYQLQHQLENLTRALRDLKHLLTELPKGKSRFQWLFFFKRTMTMKWKW